MTNRRTGLLAIVLSGWLAFAPMFSSISDAQSVRGRRNTTLGLLGGTIYHAVKGHKGEAVVFGLGTAYAWTRYEKARKAQRRNVVHSYSAARTGSSGYSGGSSGSSRYSGGSGGRNGHSNTVQGRLAALEEDFAIRQQAMQQNLDELSAQVKDRDKRTAELGAQLKTARAEATNGKKANAWYLGWALMATAFAVALGSGLLYLALKQRERLVPRRSIPAI